MLPPTISLNGINVWVLINDRKLEFHTNVEGGGAFEELFDGNLFSGEYAC